MLQTTGPRSILTFKIYKKVCHGNVSAYVSLSEDCRRLVFTVKVQRLNQAKDQHYLATKLKTTERRNKQIVSPKSTVREASSSDHIYKEV